MAERERHGLANARVGAGHQRFLTLQAAYDGAHGQRVRHRRLFTEIVPHCPRLLPSATPKDTRGYSIRLLFGRSRVCVTEPPGRRLRRPWDTITCRNLGTRDNCRPASMTRRRRALPRTLDVKRTGSAG